MSAKVLRKNKRIGDELERRGYGGARSSPMRSNAGPKARKAARRSGVSRRQFLRYGVAGGVMAGLPPLLTHGATVKPTPRRGPVEVRTMFFNFSHEEGYGNKSYYLVAAGRKFPLTKVFDQPAVLVAARNTNAFLSQVSKLNVTHHVVDIVLPADAVQLCYVTSSEDKTAGTWNMSSMFFHIPASAIATAHTLGLARFGAAGRPLSAKRKKYGMTVPAASASDLLDERALIDTSDHAVAMVAMHPEILSADPGSAAHIQVNHIAPNPFASNLSDDITQAGAAQPQQVPGQPNDVTQGWATLRPFTDANSQPLRSTEGNNVGLIQYNAEWEPTVIAPDASQAIGAVAQSTQADEVLGRDVTSMVAPSTKRTAGANPALPIAGAPASGAIWLRRDGLTSVVQSATALPRGSSVFNYTMVPSTPQAGYNCTAQVTQNGGVPHVVLSFENTFLRWLGLFIQFQDSTGAVVPVSSLPQSLVQGRISPDGQNLHIGILTPEFTLFGIPVQSSTTTVAFDFPTAVASGAKILASGLGSGSHTFPTTELFGILTTTLFNLITPVIMMAAGAAEDLDPVIKLGIIPLVTTSIQEVFAFIADQQGGMGYANLLNILVRALDKAGPGIILKIALVIAGALVAGAATDAIPIAGQIIQAVGIAGAALEITETSLQVANCPWTYEYDLSLTHDLSVTINPDQNDNTTPKAANHYKVTALFDNGGTPHVVEADLAQPQSSIPVTFTDVPLGGKVNISAAFSQVPTNPALDHVLLGKATTGLVSNAVDNLDAVNIQEIKFPIGPNTQYQHSQKIVRDPSGNHVWSATATGPTQKAIDIKCQDPGDLCDLYAITVRQGTASAAGYIGYSWRGNSAGVTDCYAPPGGQSDTAQLANLNTDTGNAGRNAQVGYAAVACGLKNKPRLCYSLLTHSTSNYYLDTTNKVVRQVLLDPPLFVDPRSNFALGAFNLDSTALLLHPTGKLISINQDNHKLETLTPLDAPVFDTDAAMDNLALVHSGQGGRPGLLQQPVAATISPDGVVLVLEQQNNRIQAFDTGANAVQFFSKQNTPYFLNLTATADGNTVYLDLAVEYTGFVYVLSYNNGTNAYRLDIYHPTQAGSNPISTTQSVNAAKLTVDFWRNVYTLNYEVLQSPAGNAEPSVSLWIPSNAA